jgi:hypothetical protein
VIAAEKGVGIRGRGGAMIWRTLELQKNLQKKKKKKRHLPYEGQRHQGRGEWSPIGSYQE